MDERLEAELFAHGDSDESYVDRVFRQVLRRPPDPEARERALGKLSEGTLSRAALVHSPSWSGTAPTATRTT